MTSFSLLFPPYASAWHPISLHVYFPLPSRESATFLCPTRQGLPSKLRSSCSGSIRRWRSLLQPPSSGDRRRRVPTQAQPSSSPLVSTTFHCSSCPRSCLPARCSMKCGTDLKQACPLLAHVILLRLGFAAALSTKNIELPFARCSHLFLLLCF